MCIRDRTTTLSKGIVLLRSLENGFGQTVRQEQPNTCLLYTSKNARLDSAIPGRQPDRNTNPAR